MFVKHDYQMFVKCDYQLFQSTKKKKKRLNSSLVGDFGRPYKVHANNFLQIKNCYDH